MYMAACAMSVNKVVLIIQCVQAAIDHQLTTLAQNNPSQRVAIVTFGNEVRSLHNIIIYDTLSVTIIINHACNGLQVTVLGDGRPENEYFIVGNKLWKEDALLKLCEAMPTPSPIRQTRELLSKKIFRYIYSARVVKHNYIQGVSSLRLLTLCTCVNVLQLVPPTYTVN